MPDLGGGYAMNPQVAQAKVPGLLVPGNINLNGRPLVANPDGSYSSELSFSQGTDQGEVLVPRVVNGQMLSEEDAWKHYLKTGEHLGIFDTPDHADAYAEQVHKRVLTNASGAPNYEANQATHPTVAPTPIPAAMRGRN